LSDKIYNFGWNSAEQQNFLRRRGAWTEISARRRRDLSKQQSISRSAWHCVQKRDAMFHIPTFLLWAKPRDWKRAWSLRNFCLLPVNCGQ